MKRFSVYRIHRRQGFERVAGEPLARQVPKGAVPSPALPEDPHGALNLSLELVEGGGDDLVRDAVPAELTADQRVSGIPISEASRPLVREPLIREEPGRREAVECLFPLFGGDPGARETLLQVMP